MFDLDSIRAQSRQAAQELLAAAHLAPGSLLVVGCSSSEITGGAIGKASSPETAQAVFQGIYPLLRENDIFLAAQCCEHLNRALILEAACAERYGYEPVSVRPQPKAGGSFAAAAWEAFQRPAAVEHIRAHAGLDIGGTLIGMHLRDVAVPVRLSLDHIGNAILLCARTRPKFIGGSRACYEGECR
ncbi:MAG: TIGR01440 family protein [Oscillospiraceae bacterium]|jgi:uncharacterized protein (TIGR01440 family)|nr:TIGR01440 family protein [Oscillospiraceae bacterium]MDE6998342.1 TIGR01440 family protein [Oscillospiraceae bacterium]